MRVWLARWEWQCCGTPFGVGDDVTLSVEPRGPSEGLVDALGAAVAAGIDRVESRHAEGPVDSISGVVDAVRAVTVRMQDRRILRRPGRGAPATATMPAEGEEWPELVQDLGGGIVARSRPTRWIIESTIVPGSATLSPARRVGRDADESAEPAPAAVAASEPPEISERTAVEGWLVDLRPARR